jgi:hypothetical protein
VFVVAVVVVVVVDSFPSNEFPVERFLVTYVRETLINEWDAQWTKRSEGGTFLGLGRSRGRETNETQDSFRRIPVDCGILSYEWTVRDTLFLWIHSPSSRVTCY